jgi:DNA-binding transcriptional ArsR family regulator
MVEYEVTLDLDKVFQSLADPTRRDILERVSKRQHSVSELAHVYRNQMSLAAVSKHIQLLEHASLIMKEKRGRARLVSASPEVLREANEYLEQYRKLWEQRLDRLEKHVKNGAQI